MSNKTTKPVFKYRSGMSVGAISAEQDNNFLEACYIETGILNNLRDVHSSKNILVGRTGAGKSAALIHIKKTEEHVIEIEPEDLAFTYITSSDILNFLSDIGVNLDVFYKLLWQHVLVVELIKYKLNLQSESDQSRVKKWLSTISRKDKKFEIASEYLENWGSKFWETTEERIKGITESFTQKLDIGASLGSNMGKLECGMSDDESVEKKTEIFHKAQQIVNGIQIQHLAYVIDILGKELFQNDEPRYYITIDRLDENWIDDENKYKLIRGLLDAIKKFRGLRSVKIIISMRTDLLQSVYYSVDDTRFQVEKYEDANLYLNWDLDQLEALLDRRVDLLLRAPYTTEAINCNTILPEEIKSKTGVEYLLSRTLKRPRDAIDFMNEILSQASGATQISTKMILDAERKYSQKRLYALFDEWRAEYPKLYITASLLRKYPDKFNLDSISKEDIDTLLLELIDKDATDDPIERYAQSLFSEGAANQEEFKRNIILLFFKVGLIGLKISPSEPLVYSHDTNAMVSPDQVTAETKIYIHPMFHYALGTKKIKFAKLEAAK